MLLLQGCVTQPIVQQVVVPIDIPSEWQVKGRMGVVIDGKAQNSSFDITFQDQNFYLTLTGILGLGQINITSKTSGLKVNGKDSTLNLKQLMSQELGWYFPLDQLGNIIFKHRLDIDDAWKLEVIKFGAYQGANVAKVARLKHSTRSIKIKLLFQEILPNLN